MYSRRGTLLITPAAVAAWAILHLHLSSAPDSRGFTRSTPPSGLIRARRWSLNARLERLPRNSFFSKGSGGTQVIANRKQKPLLYDKDKVDLDQRADTPIGFGKHKFMTYGEMVRDDPHYCAYIAEQLDWRIDQVEVHDFQDYLEAINFEAPLSFSPTSRSRNAGKSFKEVMETQPLLCGWVLNSTAPVLARFRNFLEDEGFEPPDLTGVVPSGRHEGRPFSEVLSKDPSYCTWVKHLDDDDSDMLMDFRTYLREQGCEDVIGSGKHRGRTFKEVMKDDPSYCAWVMSWSPEKGNDTSILLKFKDFLEREEFTLDPSEEVIPIGKHEGKTFEQVMEEDPVYCTWVMNLSEEEDSNSPVMLRFKTFLESRGFRSEHMMTSGKYKGNTFEEVMAEDKVYCEWVMDLRMDTINSSALVRFRRFLEDRGYRAPSEKMMTLGKHRGRTFEEVMTEDPSYCEWMMRRGADKGTNSSTMALLNEFLENQELALPSAEEVVTAGQHKGKTFGEVMTKYPLYGLWVMSRSDGDTKSTSLLRYKRFLQSKSFSPEVLIPDGKHKGKTFEEVMAKDPSYCAWVMRLEPEDSTNSSAMMRFKSFLEEKGFELPPSEEVFLFGMHKGKTFEEVATEDPAYGSWITGLIDKGVNKSSLFRFKKFLEEKESSSPPPSKAIIRFGKHKGKTFKEVAMKDPSYCVWVMDLSIENDDAGVLSSLKAFLVEQGFNASSSSNSEENGSGMPSNIVTVGMHKGKTFEEVMKQDPSYCSWVVTCSNFKAMKSFKSFLVERGIVAHT